MFSRKIDIKKQINRDLKRIRNSLKGNRRNLEKIVENYSAFCFSIALFELEDDRFAKKSVEETLNKTVNTIKELNKPINFKIWLFGILKKVMERQKDRKEVFYQNNPNISRIDFSKSYFKNLKSGLNINEKDKEAFNYIRTLPADEKIIFILSEFEGVSCMEISGILDMPVLSVRYKLYAVKKVLKEIYFQYENYLQIKKVEKIYEESTSDTEQNNNEDIKEEVEVNDEKNNSETE